MTSAATRSGERPLAAHDARRLLAGLMLAIFLAGLSQTIVGTALPTIGRDLHDFEGIPWVVTVYSLAATTALPLYGALSDTHGRRIVLLAALAIFCLGSICCALAPSMPALVLARVVQGIGSGGLISLPETVIGDMAAPRERAAYQVYIAAAFLAASLIGPAVSGLLVDHVSWRAIFWISVPLAVLASILTDAPLKRSPPHKHPHRLDAPGALLLMAALSVLILDLSWSAKRFGWGAGETLGMLALAALLFVAFLMRIRRARDPLIPVEVLADAVVRPSLVAAALGVGLIVGLSIYVPIFLQHVRGLSATTAGLLILPFMVGSTLGAFLAGRAMERSPHFRRLPLVALPITAFAAFALAAGAYVGPVWMVVAILPILSMGLGILLPIATVVIQNAVAAHHLGTATATSNLARQLGASITVAVFGPLVFARPPVSLQPFQIIFIIVGVGAGLAFLAILRLPERPLSPVLAMPDEAGTPS